MATLDGRCGLLLQSAAGRHAGQLAPFTHLFNLH
jgi:hypothetical protein